MYPVEIKKTALPDRRAAQAFPAVERFKLGRGGAAILCLSRQLLPLGPGINAVPAGFV